MAVGLTAFVRAAMRRGFTWGHHDCLMFCGDRVKAVTGSDCFARWRGRYDSEVGAQVFIDEFGSVVRLCDEAYAGILERCEPGDALVGVISSKEGDIGAVRSGSTWVLLTERGIGRVRHDLVDCLAAWGLPCRSS